MIQVLIDAMDQAAAVVSVSTRNGLCELRPSASGGRMPVKSAGGGEFVPVAEDVHGTLSYWRLLSDVVSERADVVEACEGLRYSMRLRLVMMVDRSGPCEDITSALTSVANNVRGNTRAFRTALRAASVTINSTTFVVNGVALSEFGSERVLPTGRDIVAVDFAVSVLGTSACLLGCTDAEEFTVEIPEGPCPPIRLCTDDLEDGDVPTWNGSEWVAEQGGGGGGTGDVTGPASAVNNNFSAFNGTTGKVIKDSGSNAASFDAAGAASAAQASAIAAAASDATTKANAAQAAAIAASQPLDSDLTAIAALSTTTYGRSLLTLADAAAGRTSFDLWTTVMKTVSVPRTSTTTLVADPYLKFAMAANTHYELRLVAHMDTVAAADFKFRTSGPASPTLIRTFILTYTGVASPVGAVRIESAYSATDITMLGAAQTGGYIRLEMTIHNGPNAGDFEFLWAQNTSDAGNTSVLDGSYLEWHPV